MKAIKIVGISMIFSRDGVVWLTDKIWTCTRLLGNGRLEITSGLSIPWTPTKTEFLTYLAAGNIQIVNGKPDMTPAQTRWSCGHKRLCDDRQCLVCKAFNRPTVTT